MKKKIYLIVIIVLLGTVGFCNVSRAYFDIDDIQTDVHINGGEKIKDFGNIIYSIIIVLGIAASVIVLTLIGIKYMMGSPEEKAEYKKSLMPYFIGSVLVFSASTIANILYKAI